MIIATFPEENVIVIQPKRSGKQKKSIAFLRPKLFAIYPAASAPNSWLKFGILAESKIEIKETLKCLCWFVITFVSIIYTTDQEK